MFNPAFFKSAENIWSNAFCLQKVKKKSLKKVKKNIYTKNFWMIIISGLKASF